MGVLDLDWRKENPTGRPCRPSRGIGVTGAGRHKGVHPATGVADPALGEREAMTYGLKAGYGRRGAHIGTEDDHARLFHEDMMSFWRRGAAR